MSRAKQNTKTKTTRIRTVRVSKRVPRPLPGLTSAELSYARQLVDPCGSRLSSPPIGGSEGSFICRSKGIGTLNIGAEGNQYSGYVFYHPTFGAFYNAGIGTTGTCGPYTALNKLSVSATPVNTGLSTRSVAACLKIRFIGSELNRQGTMGAGIVPGSMVWQCIRASAAGGGEPISPSFMMSSIEHAGRTPPGDLEVAWVPGTIDTEFHDAQYYDVVTDPGIGQAYEAILSRTNFVCVVWEGVGTVNSAVQFEATSIQERYLEANNTTLLGNNTVVSAGKRSAGSTSTIDKVVNFLQSKDSTWYINGAMKMGRFLGLALNPMAGMVGMVGNMSLGTSRPRQAIAYM